MNWNGIKIGVCGSGAMRLDTNRSLRLFGLCSSVYSVLTSKSRKIVCESFKDGWLDSGVAETRTLDDRSVSLRLFPSYSHVKLLR